MLFMSLLVPKGKGKEAIEFLKRIKTPEGITVRDVYVTFGRYDGVVLFEASDSKTALKFAMEIGFATDYTLETLSAVPVQDLKD
ncbi:MAG: GYD domain-containing protein [Dehalococcoidales bacterium]|nr:GYD domain-containing protein [Dehalococcoidales bacterium]